MKGLFKQFSVPLFLFLCFAVAFTISARKDLRIRCDVAAEQLKRTAWTVSGILRPIVSDAINKHHNNLQELKRFLDKVVDTTDVEVIRLELGNKKFLAVPDKLPPHEGSGNCCPLIDRKDRYIYHSVNLSVSSEAVQSICNQSGNKISLVIAMPLQSCQMAEDEAYESFKRRLAWGCVIGITFLTASVFSIKNFNLNRQLNFAKKREEQFAEFNLAASGLAHETKNPLSIIRGQAECLLQDDSCGEAVEEIAEQILHQADRTVDRLGDFMNYARIEARNKEIFELSAFVKDLTVGLNSAFSESKVTIEADLVNSRIEADRDLLRDILTNLLMNSFEAMKDGGKIFVKSKLSGSKISLIVADNGEGIPEKLRESLFKPYVTGKSGGHGIGLSIVRRAVEASGWKIDFSSEEGKGTSFVISGIKVG